MAWYNTKGVEQARKFYGTEALLDLFSPRNFVQMRALWAQWILFFLVIVAAAAGPNASSTPTLARAGALQVEAIYDVSNSMNAEDYRAYDKPAPGDSMPTAMYQWGTRIEHAKRIMNSDFMPQLKDNEVGLITMEGSGYNMWDLTRDHSGALAYMHRKFVKVGAAPGGGSDYTSGIKAALDEFNLISPKDDSKVRFIVLFSDGGFTGDRAELDKILEECNKRNVRIVLVGLGGSAQLTVPKYDPTTQQRNGAFNGTTAYEPGIYEHIQSVAKDATILMAPPGTDHVSFNFPAKAGGLYAIPTKSNMYPWLLIFDMLLLVSITIGGGGLPKWRLAVAFFLEPYIWLKDKLKRSK